MGSGALLLVWSRSLVIRCFGYIKIFSVGLLQLPAANNDHDGADYNSSHSHALPTHAPPSTYPLHYDPLCTLVIPFNIASKVFSNEISFWTPNLDDTPLARAALGRFDTRGK